jgi:hypothetical protein
VSALFGSERLYLCFGTHDPIKALEVLTSQTIARYGPSTDFVNVAYLRTLRDGMREQAWAERKPMVCPPSDDGCDVPTECTCPRHPEDAEFACGEDEAAGCHYCKHRDIYLPCPHAVEVVAS